MKTYIYPANCCQECGKKIGYFKRIIESLLNYKVFPTSHASWCGKNV